MTSAFKPKPTAMMPPTGAATPNKKAARSAEEDATQEPVAGEGEAMDSTPLAVLVFDANDPSGAGGLAAAQGALASMDCHVLPVACAILMRDSSAPHSSFEIDSDIVAEQARTVLEDTPIAACKVGFLGGAENIATCATILADYPDVPLVLAPGNLSWFSEGERLEYLEALTKTLLPRTQFLCGNVTFLSQWLLPQWQSERNPSARDIARAAARHGVAFTLITGILLPDGSLDNVLADAQGNIVGGERFERMEPVFAGSGDTLSAALAGMLALGCDPQESVSEALVYLDHALANGYQPGMGQSVPDRLFWAWSAPGEGEEEEAATPTGGARKEGRSSERAAGPSQKALRWLQ